MQVQLQPIWKLIDAGGNLGRRVTRWCYNQLINFYFKNWVKSFQYTDQLETCMFKFIGNIGLT